MNQMQSKTMGLLALGAGSLFLAQNMVFTVQPGQNAIIFSKLSGLSDTQLREGFHFKVPIIQHPIIFNVQTRPITIKGVTANKDMQNVNLSLRVLFRPKEKKLAELYRYLGLNYDERVMSSIVNEVVKSVVAQYSALQLMSQRDQISNKIRKQLEERASNFFIIIDDVSITELHFNPEFVQAIESKQVAQQDAERAKYLVEQAKETKKSCIIRAQGESASISLIGKMALDNPAYIDLRKIENAKKISEVIASAKNNFLLDSNNLNLSLATSLPKN